MPRPTQKSPTHWIDHDGAIRKTPKSKERLRPHFIELHARLRDHVFARDGYRCKHCGTRYAPFTVDHVLSIRNGGTHHPSNLQTLCKACNDTKSRYEDRGRARPFVREAWAMVWA